MDLYDNAPVDRMWFGTEQKMGWIETPQTGADVSSLGRSENAVLENGGGVARNSWDSHKVFQFSWGNGATPSMVSLLQAYRNGSYGRGLLYFHDPMFYHTNLLPKRWADPSMAANYEAEPIIPDVWPTTTPIVATSANHPITQANYNVTSNYSSQSNNSEHFIPIPDGMTLVLGAVYSGTATLYVRTPAGISDIIPMNTGDSTVVNTVIRNQPWARIGIRKGTGAGQISIVSMTARLATYVEAGAGVSYSYTNLATAPSFEAAGANVVVRTNGCINPKPTSATGWSSSGNASFGPDGYTTTNAIGVTPYIFSAGRAGGAVTGRIYAMSALIRATSVSGGTASSVAIRPHKNTGNVYYTPDGGSINIPLDGVQRLVQFYWTATADIAEAEIFNMTAVANGGGGILSMDEVLIEEVPLKPVNFPTFFYGGGASPDPDGTVGWVGAANATASIMTMMNAGAYASSPSVNFVRSGQWSSEGSFSGRLSPLGTSMDTYAILRTLTAADAGKTFRVLITVRLTSPTLSDSAFSRSLFYTGTGGNIQGPKAPNVAGTSIVEMTITVPTVFTAGTIRFYHGGAYGDSDVWIDSLQISDDGYTGPAFTGRTPGAIWNGAVDNSTSTLSGRTPITGDVGAAPWMSGEGHSGCRFQGNPTVVNYNGVNGGQIGLSAIFQEVGAWE